MNTKKKLKTKLDYQIRTFGFCVLLMFAFTVLFVSPNINKMEENNAALEEEIRVQEDLCGRLQYENSELLTEGTIENNG